MNSYAHHLQQQPALTLPDKRFSVGGFEYHAMMLGAAQGREVLLKLLNIVGEPLAVLAAADDLDAESAARAMVAALKVLDASTLAFLCKTFGDRCTYRNGEAWPQLTEAVFDIHFAGRYGAMVQWLWECIAFNFTADFLGDSSPGSLGATLAKARERLAEKAAAKARASQSQKDSTGSSGES